MADLLERYLSPSQAARRSGYSVEAIHAKTRKGQLPYLPTANGKLIHADDADALAAQRRQRAAQQQGAGGAAGAA